MKAFFEAAPGKILSELALFVCAAFWIIALPIANFLPSDILSPLNDSANALCAIAMSSVAFIGAIYSNKLRTWMRPRSLPVMLCWVALGLIPFAYHAADGHAVRESIAAAMPIFAFAFWFGIHQIRYSERKRYALMTLLLTGIVITLVIHAACLVIPKLTGLSSYHSLSLSPFGLVLSLYLAARPRLPRFFSIIYFLSFIICLIGVMQELSPRTIFAGVLPACVMLGVLISEDRKMGIGVLIIAISCLFIGNTMGFFNLEKLADEFSDLAIAADAQFNALLHTGVLGSGAGTERGAVLLANPGFYPSEAGMGLIGSLIDNGWFQCLKWVAVLTAIGIACWNRQSKLTTFANLILFVPFVALALTTQCLPHSLPTEAMLFTCLWFAGAQGGAKKNSLSMSSYGKGSSQIEIAKNPFFRIPQIVCVYALTLAFLAAALISSQQARTMFKENDCSERDIANPLTAELALNRIIASCLFEAGTTLPSTQILESFSMLAKNEILPYVPTRSMLIQLTRADAYFQEFSDTSNKAFVQERDPDLYDFNLASEKEIIKQKQSALRKLMEDHGKEQISESQTSKEYTSSD